MDPEKLRKLLRNIRDTKYPASSLQEVDAFEQRLAVDLGIEQQEALALLGYLLARDYVRIIPDMGLVLNPQNEEVRRIVDSGALDAD